MQGRTIGGYNTLAEIGSGGQGAVYRAWDPSSGQIVALKTLLAYGEGDLDAVRRFRREAELAAEVEHPNVIRILDSGWDQDSHYIVMDLLPLSVADLIRSFGQLPVGRAVDICRQAALGLQAANDQGIIHRDVKPSNLLVGHDATVKVTDFGLARSSNLPTMTSAGVVMGTQRYMAPEQRKDARVDTRADIYSLGLVLHEMLTGTVPSGPVLEEGPEIPVILRPIVRRSLNISPEHRFQSPGEFAAALDEPEVSNRVALIDLYNATDGPNWSDDTYWLTEFPVFMWYGVTANPSGEVTRLDLEDNGLRGRIPAGLVNLGSLTHLNLGDNELTGPMPSEIGRLSRLQELRLDNNGLTGMLPREWGNLTNLKLLTVISTDISGRIPTEWGNLANLEALHIAGTAISGELPVSLGRLSRLRDLYLHGNRLTGEIPSELCDLSNLEELHLDGNRWTGCIPSGLRSVRDNDLSKLGIPFCDG